MNLLSLELLDSLPVLVRDGIRLREVHLSDAAGLTTLFKKPEVSAHLDPPPATIDDFSSWITLSQSRRAQNTAVSYTLFVNDEISGLFMSLRMKEQDRAEIGFAIAPHLWGTGVFQTAIALYVDFLFTQWGIKVLIGKTQIRNVRAVGAMRKLGGQVIDESERNGYPEYVWTIALPIATGSASRSPE